MDELLSKISNIIEQKPSKFVLSSARGAYRKGAVRPLDKGGWQVERFSATQAFHKNISEAQLPQELVALLQQDFFQLTAFAANREYQLRLTKKGRVLASTKQAEGAAAPASKSHNREKRLPLEEGIAIPVLVETGVLTAEGRVAADKRDKFRQINRFLQLVEDEIKYNKDDILRIVDFGCGLSTLTFVLYHYLERVKGYKVEMTGLDLRQDLMEQCSEAAAKYGYEGLRFITTDVADYRSSQPVDMVVSLHACDTATDLALFKAVEWEARMVFSVPCCQHELNNQIKTEEFSVMTRYGLIKERTASLMTDALRANFMAACGYKTQLVEFVGFEHTPKNIMIRAHKAALPAAQRREMLDEALRLCDAFCLQPTLLTLLKESGRLP